MKNRSSVKAMRVLTLAALGYIVAQFLAGSVALSQPFPSFILDTTFVKGPGLDYASGTRVAVGNGINLVVWKDGASLCGARVNASCLLLDSLPIDIDGPDLEAFVNMRPQVAWSGSNFLVAWSNWDQTMFALVEPDGQVTLRKVLQDSVTALQSASAAVGFDGTNFLVAWSGLPNEGREVTFFCRVTSDGAVLDSPPRLVVPGNTNDQYDIAVGFHNDRYLAAWLNRSGTNDLWGSFIMPDGSIPDSVGFPIRSGVETDYPCVTHNGHSFVVSWTEVSRRTVLARVTDQGLVLDTAGVLIDSYSRTASDVVSVGDTTFLVICSDSAFNGDSTSILAFRLDTALRRLDSAPIVISPPGPGGAYGYDQSDPSVAFAGYGYVTAWCKPFCIDMIACNMNAVLHRLDRQGRILDTAAVIVSYGTNSHSYPDVASDGAHFLAVWIDTRHDSVERSEAVCGMRFSPDGERLDPAGFRISPAGAARPTLAFGGGCYLVCWTHEGDVYGARVLPDGSLPDSMPITMEHDSALTAYHPDVAFGDSMFLVVWRAGNMVHGTRVRPDGVVADTAPKILQPHLVRGARYPQVGFDGRNFLVVRNEHGDDFRAVRVSTTGELLDTTDIVFGAPASSSSIPKVAFGDSVYVVVDSRGYSASRISSQGVVLDSTIYTSAHRPSVVFDGANFMLVCRGDTATELGGLRITPEGRVLDSLPFLLTVTDGATVSYDQHAAVTSNGEKVGLVFRATEPSPYLAGRIRAAAFPAVGIGAGHEDTRAAPFRALPNPASRTVSLSFGLRQAGPVQVSAFDAAGRRCAVVHSGRMPAGAHGLSYDTRRLANGVYFLRFEAGTDTRSARLVVSH